MLDQKTFGMKLRNHRKNLEMTQEEAGEKIGVSAQAISKWEAGDCLPDCFNLKAISDVYKISVDVLLETESNGNIDEVANKIEQLGTEFVWAVANTERYTKNIRQELGEDLWKIWKGLYFIEVGNKRIQAESKEQGNLRICGNYGLKIWDDAGVACVVKSSFVKSLDVADRSILEVLTALSTEEGQKLIITLDCQEPVPKEELVEKTGVEINRLNELLLLFTENKIIEFVPAKKISGITGYKISGHCGLAAYMVLTAAFILGKKEYTLSEYHIYD